MFKSYLKLTIRTLIRNKQYSIINIIGLSVAIALCIVAYLNHDYSRSFNTFHTGAERLFSLQAVTETAGEREAWSLIPGPLPLTAESDVPGIAAFTRIETSSAIMGYGEHVFSEYVYFVDDDFMEMFSFPLLAGSKSALSEQESIVLTRELAEKYFGDSDAIGRVVTLSFDGQTEFDFKVTGVVENVPKNSSLQFSLLLPFANVERVLKEDPTEWSFLCRAAIIELQGDASPQAVERALQSNVAITKNNHPDWQIEAYRLESLLDLPYSSRELRGDPFQNGFPVSAVIGPTITAILVLLLACFNFVNTAIAFSARRLKEIGIRKVVGGFRRQLVAQFLGESLVLCAIALTLGLMLAEVFVPAYDSLWPYMDLDINYTENWQLVAFLGGLLLFTGVAAGAYPAFYVSAFRPVKIFQGRQQLGGTGWLTRGLLMLQFTLSMAAIITSLVFSNNANYIRTMDLGFDREQLLVVYTREGRQHEILRAALTGNPDITSIGSSRSLIGSSWMTTDVKIDGGEMRVRVFDMGKGYFETAGLELVTGRQLDPDRSDDLQSRAIINETMARRLGWQDLEDKYVNLIDTDSQREYRVVGIVKDFHYNGVWRKIEPVILRLGPKEEYRYFSVKLSGDDLSASSATVEREWKRLFPQHPYDAFFQEELLAEAIHVSENIEMIFAYVAAIAIIIAGMGLFALVSLNIARRVKEIGIRKILGATVVQIGGLISREFVIILIVASIFAAAAGAFMAKSLISSIYAYHVPFNLISALIAALTVAALAGLTVGAQVVRVATSNPVNAIRDE